MGGTEGRGSGAGVASVGFAVVVASLLVIAGWRLAVRETTSENAGPPLLSIAPPNETRVASVENEVDPAEPPSRRRFAHGWQLPRMVDVDGVLRHPGTDASARALVFLFVSTECPISNGYLPELNRLFERFGDRVEMYGVIADRFTSPAEAAGHRRKYGITFPVLLDTTGILQRRTGATVTPEAVVVDAAGEVVYRGRIDDRYRELARPRPEPEQRDLETTLVAVIDGEAPPVARTKAIGCALEPIAKNDARTDFTYCRDVAPILFANCTRCHREGQSAPLALVTPDDARRRATQLAEVVKRRLMPPWQPKAGFGHFLNERRLDEREIAVITQWAAAGAPIGDEADLPPLPTYPTEWQLGEPDLVLEMPEPFDVPADGPDIYQHIVIPTGLLGNQLVRAFEFQPGAASVVHHSWVYFDNTGEGRRLDALDPRPGYERFGGPGFYPAGNLGGWGPGGLPRELPKGMGRNVPGGSDLVLQIHYHPTGRAERDRSRVGLYFAPPDANRLVTEIMVADVDFEIPAGEPRYRYETSFTLPVETDLLDASPHMHLLGREMKLTATTPAGDVIPLIWIKDWNFYWQDHYVFEQPVRVPAGTRLDMVAWYDNSEGNPHNPHSPPRTARYGEYSDDEMAICYFQVTTPKPNDVYELARHATEEYQAMMKRYEANKREVPSIPPEPPPVERATSRSAGANEPTPAAPLPGFTNDLGMEFVGLPAGTFTMGTRETERFAPYSRCEEPARGVTLTRPFGMGKYEVTVGQFRRFVEATGYRTAAERDGRGCNGVNLQTGALVRKPEWVWSSPPFPQSDRHPVVGVTWEDAVAFCAWLSKRDGRRYRLPTEAEWEYACRGGSRGLFCSGDEPADLRGYANCGDVALRRAFPASRGNAPWDDGHGFTAPVGSFRANAFGLFDMHGNVGEWCHDWYAADQYHTAATTRDDTDPTGPVGPTKWRVVRGGSWYNTPTSCRSSGRHDGIETARSITNGFRVVVEANVGRSR